ncbi:DUF4132 domain-containing protein [Glycomyces niveus]|uniref:DUF4132 domain-containing protein n=1 Tax=Glycomyces niveus TaxID=2820287 RepID=A0ABS3U399_9ACTN|nr:DUF4132 domain-containing protein [Glycomyces sp. NEAU-S30]MBO3733251.1 DUF4132 domain-containing protein [Glycomyces sp. NEAU-S30]
MNDVASQEDQLALPAAWKAKLLPWRGKRAGRPFSPAGPEVVGRQRQKIAARYDKVRTALAKPENEPYAADAEAFLAGEADPRGAAAVAALILDYDGRSSESYLRPELDFWLHEHGTVFALVATVERLAIAPTTNHWYGGGAIAERVVFHHDTEHPETCVHELLYGGIAAVRSLLASLPDDEYAEVVAAVAEHRDTGAKRIAAMLLFPGEDAWVLEACAEFAQARAYDSQADDLIWHCVSRREHLAAAGTLSLANYYQVDYANVAALIGGLGTVALPVLLDSYADTQNYDADFRKLLFRAIALMPSDEAAAFVLEHLDQPNVWEAAADTAARFPVRTLRTAARLAPNASPALRPWLHAVAHLVDADLRAHLDEDDRAALADLLADSGRLPDADPADLPPLLVAPPWTVKRPKAKPVVIEGLEAPAARLVWAAGEQEAWSGVRDYYYDPDDEYWTELPEPSPDDWHFLSFLAFADAERAERLLGAWNAAANPGATVALQRILARFGERVIDQVLVLPASQHTCHELPGPILNLAAARIAAERLARLKGARPSAVRWLDRHGIAVAPYLVPDALGADKKRRSYAEVALVFLAGRHGRDAVAAGAATYGPEAAEAIRALLDVDPLEPRVQVPKPGTWASPAVLPQVQLKDGEHALPDAAVRRLITVLALGTPDYAYPGIEVVAEHCDRASLTRFSRALFERWTAIGSPAKDSWAFTQLMHFADDATVWDLAPRIREWPGQNQHKRAVTGLEILGAIGTETAMRAIQTISEKVKFKALKEEARRQITRIAEDLGLSREQLADRLVPDFGLGEASALVLDYGPRKFLVAFDEQLKPYVTDEDGKPRKTLPKPGAKDDPELAEDAYQRFTALKKELRSVAADQVRRLETAMTTGRDWSAEEFQRYFVEHPLTGHLARRLVWLAETDGDRLAFHIAEDGTFSDGEDDTAEIPEGARIRIAHPVLLGDTVRGWAELFADYEVLQPFDQLGRPALAFTDDELATGRLKRFEGAKVDVGRVLGMTARGWQRASPEDGGVSPGISYPVPGGHLVVSLEPGIWLGDVGEETEQTLEAVRLAAREQYYWPEQDDASRDFPTDIDPVTASEILAALERLTSA